MSSTMLLEKINRMEKEIQVLKIESVLKLREKIKEISIVKKTCGILSKKFSKGVKFEDSLRKDWKNRFKELKI